MSLFGFDHRQHERSYAEDQADMQTGHVGEVCDAQGYGSRSHRVHYREQTQTERDLVENGAEDCRLVEDEPGQIQDPGREHLHEARAGVAVIWA